MPKLVMMLHRSIMQAFSMLSCLSRMSWSESIAVAPTSGSIIYCRTMSYSMLSASSATHALCTLSSTTLLCQRMTISVQPACQARQVCRNVDLELI